MHDGSFCVFAIKMSREEGRRRRMECKVCIVVECERRSKFERLLGFLKVLGSPRIRNPRFSLSQIPRMASSSSRDQEFFRVQQISRVIEMTLVQAGGL